MTTILMCARKVMDASLIYYTEPKTKTEKITENKNGYAQTVHNVLLCRYEFTHARLTILILK